MSYLVLARKWRPRRFAELVGQEHVVRALSNALESGRVHHAYLFTGTRGVGKTTIARIFAKSLNCEKGVGADPCGECAVCTAVDAGRFVDLLEIDAASNTGVDDVRDVIENAQYLPTRGRYKVYLIDEVHMLSKQAFNALLKTLEEPPEHVKFLLATTDPEKLLVTVLSRCLQFNLKRLSEEQIGSQMDHILQAEAITAEPAAIKRLSHAADGSMRDGLSLLDQAIAYGGGAVTEDDVTRMLGSVDRGQVDTMLSQLADANGAALLQTIEEHASYSAELGATLEAIAERLHQVQLAQLVPSMSQAVPVPGNLLQLPAETVQLWYQMAINGRRDLYAAPSARIGFEMTLLRMLAFVPLGDEQSGKTAVSASGAAAAKPHAAAGSANATRNVPSAAAAPDASATRADPAPPVSEPIAPQRVPTAQLHASSGHQDVDRMPAIPAHSVREFDRDAMGSSSSAGGSDWRSHAPRAATQPMADGHAVKSGSMAVEVAASTPAVLGIADNEQWVSLLGRVDLRGPVRELAGNALFISLIDDQLRLALPAAYDMLRNDSLTEKMADALQPHLGVRPQIRFDTAADSGRVDTLSARDQAQRSQRQQDAEASFMANAAVQGLVNDFGARTIPGSIRPAD